MSELDREEEVARLAAAAASNVILRRYKGAGDVTSLKEDRTPVTGTDLEANRALLEILGEAFPDDPVLSEESADDPRRLGSRRVWIVDPLDGTKDYVARTDDFAVLVGLAIDGSPVLGVVQEPVTGRCFVARRGGGAWLETPAGRIPARGSRERSLEHLRIGVSRHAGDDSLRRFVTAASHWATIVVRGASVKFGLLACGELDAVVCLNTREREWDTCAPEVVMHEAGCRLTDLDGRPFRYNQPDLRHLRGSLATNGHCHDEVLELVRPFLP